MFGRQPWVAYRLFIRSAKMLALRHAHAALPKLARGYRAERTRSRLSMIWVPTGDKAREQNEDAHNKLIRAGFIRQSHSGIFHLLPLGRRVQDKLETLIDHYMQRLGASKVALSTITSKDLWQKSGRLSQLESELFGFEDRKGARYMLSPTHEEETTSLVARTVKSYKELPLRLYQITRKFRDELRPRHGLLRSREFTMKDLYTFDISTEAALETYSKVQSAYAGIFGALRLPVMVARASSGDMGGDLSHEYHLPTPTGEDTVITCNKCDYAVNTEIAETRTGIGAEHHGRTTGEMGVPAAKIWRGISKDRSTLVNVWYPGQLLDGSNVTDIHSGDISVPAIKSVVPDLDASIDDPLPLWREAVISATMEGQVTTKMPRLLNLVDFRLSGNTGELLRQDRVWPLSGLDAERRGIETVTVTQSVTGRTLNLLTAREGDGCPCCDDGILKVQKALEVGHTFHLGTRYSEPLGAMVSMPASAMPQDKARRQPAEKTVLMQMGCHGIGVSRLIGAVAEHFADHNGLQWPRAIAPYEVAVVPSMDFIEEAVGVYDLVTTPLAGFMDIDVVLDDRKVTLPWKLKDADLVGYPVVVVLGKVWRESGDYEVQCRQLGVRETVPLTKLRSHILGLLERL